jgi:predicted GNAT family acetyltransferase
MRELLDYNTQTWRARNARLFGIRLDDGALAAVTLLFSDGGEVAQVEDVYTIPEARGRGYARALVTHAAGLARSEGHQLTFIVADDNDWPKQLYAKVGFEPVGRSWLFHRPLRAMPPAA